MGIFSICQYCSVCNFLMFQGTTNSQQAANNFKQQTGASANYQSSSTAPTSSGSTSMKQELQDK